ncbi:MAG: hypothetical protein O3B31_04585 [Chloroflexi bacterium]|nr:hypothetical protein [Chloroflexota bacterium]MDA1002610.1 hypothetical protein [Chloroflexota bacterium]
MSDRPILDLALRLWPGVRDSGAVEDPTDLDTLLDAQGRPGAVGYELGVRGTFACFPVDQPATLTLATGETVASDAEARFIAHLLVTRTLLGAGMHVDERVTAAICDAYALSWTAKSGAPYSQTPLALAVSLWLIALDPLSDSDRPLPIDWSPAGYHDPARWDLAYRLFSHYDIRERATDWAAYVSAEPGRHDGCSTFAIIEPLLRMASDARARIALAQLSEADGGGGRAPAAAMLERGRIAALLQAFVRDVVRGTARGADERPRPQF